MKVTPSNFINKAAYYEFEVQLQKAREALEHASWNCTVDSDIFDILHLAQSALSTFEFQDYAN